MCKLSLIMEGGLRPPPQRGRAPSAPAPFVIIISDSLHIPGLEKLTAGYFRPTVGIFSLSAVLQSAPAASLRLLFRLFFGYLPRRRLRLFFCYLWAISGFLWNSMAVVGSGHHNFWARNSIVLSEELRCQTPGAFKKYCKFTEIQKPLIESPLCFCTFSHTAI